MSKPFLVTLPFVLLLLDYWPLRRIGPDGRMAPRCRGSLPRSCRCSRCPLPPRLIGIRTQARAGLPDPRWSRSRCRAGSRAAWWITSGTCSSWCGRFPWPCRTPSPRSGRSASSSPPARCSRLVTLAVCVQARRRPVPSRGLVLVPRRPGAGDRARAAGEDPAHGPLHVPAPHRARHPGGVGRRGSAARPSAARAMDGVGRGARACWHAPRRRSPRRATGRTRSRCSSTRCG